MLRLYSCHSPISLFCLVTWMVSNLMTIIIYKVSNLVTLADCNTAD